MRDEPNQTLQMMGIQRRENNLIKKLEKQNANSKVMKPAESIHKHSVTVRGHELKIKPALLRRLAPLPLFLCAALIYASLPAAAEPTLNVNGSTLPDPVSVGSTITVTFTPGVTCDPNSPEFMLNEDPTYYVGDNPLPFPMQQQPDGSWSGTYTTKTSDAGSDTISLVDCSDSVEAVPLTVVELQAIDIKSAPASSGWAGKYYKPLENYVALKSPVSTDVVTYKADVIPNTATAGTLITWSGATAASDHLTATIAANSTSGPTPVNASTTSCTTAPITNWVFWVSITYNFNRPLTPGDNLTFDCTYLPSSGPSLTNAGPYVGIASPSYYSLALNKTEIIGTLAPSGVGNVIGDIFTINHQIITDSLFWNDGSDGLDSGPLLSLINGDATGYNYSLAGNDGIFDASFMQTTPVNDKIFAVDAPGVGERYSDIAGYAICYEAATVSFKDYFYIGGTDGVKASDAGVWGSHSKTTFSYGVPSSICHAGSDLTEPTYWGSDAW